MQVFFSVMAGTFSVGNALPFLNSVCVAIGAVSTIFGIIDNKPNIDSYSSQGKKIRKIQGKIEFKNVSFRYPTRYSIPVSYTQPAYEVLYFSKKKTVQINIKLLNVVCKGFE